VGIEHAALFVRKGKTRCGFCIWSSVDFTIKDEDLTTKQLGFHQEKMGFIQRFWGHNTWDPEHPLASYFFHI